MSQKILLIEHDESICISLQQWLVECGYNVILATEGGDEGILLAVTESPDLILIATDLLVIDGLQAIKILKKSTVTQQIPIISLTVLTTDSEWNRVLSVGCDACEFKPIDHASLLNKIKALLEPRPYRQAMSADVVLFPEPAVISKKLNRPQPEPVEVGFKQVASQHCVVYIDDSPMDSNAMSAIVQEAGHRFGNITNPLEALPKLLEIKPQLIFLDLVMPFTDGYEVCAQIRRVAIFKRTPIIIVTNNDGIIDRVRARIVGVTSFCSKPVTEQRVLKVLNKYLEPSHSNLSERFSRLGLLPFV